jgi:hypothetical protein
MMFGVLLSLWIVWSRNGASDVDGSLRSPEMAIHLERTPLSSLGKTSQVECLLLLARVVSKHLMIPIQAETELRRK